MSTTLTKSSDPTTSQSRKPGNRWLILGVLALAQLMVVLD